MFVAKRARSGIEWLAVAFLAGVSWDAHAQPPQPRKASARSAGVTAPSRVFPRGDREILTFESEDEYDSLEDSFRKQADVRPEPGTMTRLYLRSRTDGSVQPYAIRLPRDFQDGTTYPLVVQLHGTNFKEVLSGARGRYQGMGGPQWIEPDLRVIYVSCFGRPTTFYRGMGEEDVLEVIDEVKRRFPVNPERVYIMGHSMGGAGAYELGLHYPDRFGGIMPLDPAMGRINPMPRKDGPTPAWMEPQVLIRRPENLYPNARNVDVFFKNAGAGVQRQSTEFSDGIVEQGGFSTTEIFPGLPHNFGESYGYSHFVTELIQHPIKRRPPEVKYYTNTLRYNRAYWVTIDRLTRHNADARVTATCDETRGLQITTSNIDALTLRLDDSPTPRNGPIVVDGTTVLPGHSGGVLALSRKEGSWTVGPWSGSPLVKTHGLQGPIDDAFNARFLAVYGEGEGDRDLAIAELDAVRNPPSVLDIHGDFPMKAAARVSPEDVRSSNLILFGTVESHSVLRRLAPSLPAALLQTREAGERAVFIYPNPENPARYIVVWPSKLLSTASEALWYAWIMPLNVLPDYVWVKDGQVVSGGHFDSDWRLGPR